MNVIFKPYLKRNIPVKMGDVKLFTMFLWQDSFDMMNSNESVKLLFIQTEYVKTNFDHLTFNYHKLDFTSLY